MSAKLLVLLLGVCEVDRLGNVPVELPVLALLVELSEESADNEGREEQSDEVHGVVDHFLLFL